LESFLLLIVTDGPTDGQTDRQTDAITMPIAVRSAKNYNYIPKSSEQQ